MGKKKTTNIPFGSGNTERDGVNAHMAKGGSGLTTITLPSGKKVQVETTQPDRKDRDFNKDLFYEERGRA